MAKNCEMAKFWLNGEKYRNGEKQRNGEKWRNGKKLRIVRKGQKSEIIESKN